MMTRKHFKALAEACHGISDDVERKQAARLIANVCQVANSRFDRQKFYEAANVV